MSNNDKGMKNGTAANKFHIDIKEIKTLAVIILAYAVLSAIGVGCPLKWMTGISCAGCGMTRAYVALLKGDLHQAFYYHPLFFMPPFIFVGYAIRSAFSKKVQNILLYIVCTVFLAVYLWRMFSPADMVVTCHPLTESLPARVIALVKGVIAG